MNLENNNKGLFITDDDDQDQYAEIVPEGTSFNEQVIRQVILGYASEFNKHNEKFDVNFLLTITVHKVATRDGNKDAGYLRLARQTREKGKIEWDDAGVIHEEVYFFKSLREQADPRSLWRDQLYANCLGRLIAAGIEYAELLKKLKQSQTNQNQEESNLVVAKELPKPLTPDEQQYADWVKNEKAKEGL